MLRAILSLICAVCIGGTAHAGARPESLEELTYNLNTRFNDELDGKAFLNGRLIVRVERVSTCVSAVWTRNITLGGSARTARRFSDYQKPTLSHCHKFLASCSHQ